MNENVAGNISFIPTLVDWILDIGASKHVTSSHSSSPSSSNSSFVWLPNGTQLSISHVENIPFSTNIILHDVLHIINFQCNLIYIQKLIHDANCFVIFLPTFCVIQDQVLRRPIGLSDTRHGVCYLHLVIASLVSSVHHTTCVVLWHQHLGRASFHNLS